MKLTRRNGHLLRRKEQALRVRGGTWKPGHGDSRMSGAYRQLEQVKLPRPGRDARQEIVQAAADAFEPALDNEVNWRIAMVSDGFPDYIRRVTEKFSWSAFASDKEVSQIDSDRLLHGLSKVILSTAGELKRPHEKAVAPEMENLVWATADHEDLIRSVDGIFQSYQVNGPIAGCEGRSPSRIPCFQKRIRRGRHAALISTYVRPHISLAPR
ncbi:MAG TPA: hypothetical protein VF534_11000 [Paraburkholderia sp.]